MVDKPSKAVLALLVIVAIMAQLLTVDAARLVAGAFDLWLGVSEGRCTCRDECACRAHLLRLRHWVH
jgi:hypothetical protein